VLDERIAFDGSFGIPRVAVRSPTPSECDPLDDSDDEDAKPAVPDKGKVKASTSSSNRKVRQAFSLLTLILSDSIFL
jgi:hypothetical protein